VIQKIARIAKYQTFLQFISIPNVSKSDALVESHLCLTHISLKHFNSNFCFCSLLDKTYKSLSFNSITLGCFSQKIAQVSL
jgi:hypothetical protein